MEKKKLYEFPSLDELKNDVIIWENAETKEKEELGGDEDEGDLDI